MAGLMAGAFFGKIGADFSRVWIVTWFAAALLALFGERLAVSRAGQAMDPRGTPQPPRGDRRRRTGG